MKKKRYRVSQLQSAQPTPPRLLLTHQAKGNKAR